LYQTTESDFAPGDFLLRRLVRIAPLYWALTLLYGALAFAMPEHLHSKVAPFNYLAAFLFLPSRNLDGDIYPPIVQGWVLVYQMFFYLVLAGVTSVVPRRRLLGITAVLSGLAIAGAGAGYDDVLWTAYTDPLPLEFLMGCVIAHTTDRLWLGKGTATALALIGIALLFAGTELASATTRVLYSGVPASMLVAGMVQLERHIAFDRWRTVQAIGDSSYSIYLSHMPFALYPIGIVAVRLQPMAAAMLLPLWVGICIVVGLVCYRFAEKPMTDFVRRLSIGCSRRGPSTHQVDVPTTREGVSDGPSGP
jgi:exopolysaccharide production protein ExoZ